MGNTRLLILLSCFAFFSGISNAAEKPAIYLGRETSSLEQQAAVELQRFLYEASGTLLEIKNEAVLDEDAAGFVLGTPDTLPEVGPAWPFGLEPPVNDGYVLHAVRPDNGLVAIASPTPRGVLNGVFGLLEKLGFGFYPSGAAVPETPLHISRLDVPDLHESRSPMFEVRGPLPWFTSLCGASTWSPADYKAYIDCLVHMRCNFIGFHVSDVDPFAAYAYDGQTAAGQPLPNTSRPGRWARPVATSRFLAGVGEYYPGEVFGAPSSFIEDRAASIQQAKRDLHEALAYAKTRGLAVGLGFEIRGDAFDPVEQERFEVRLNTLLTEYPMLDYVWLWEPETFSAHPPSEPAWRSVWDSYVRRWADNFSDVGDPRRSAEAVRLTAYALQARRILEAVRPDVRLVVSGWASRPELAFTDFHAGMDRLLPSDVVFAALDNAPAAPVVNGKYGTLSPERRQWPILWLEIDGDLWMPQPNLHEVAAACRDARGKGCQGVFGIHWRTRDIDLSAGYWASFAWEPDLTVEEYCAQYARNIYGTERGPALTQILLDLEKLGYRWVGGEGQNESSGFAWTPGDEHKAGQLDRVAYQLRTLFRGPGWVETISHISLPPLVQPHGMPSLAAFRKQEALADLSAYIDYVLAYDRAARDFAGNGPLDELLAAGKRDEAVALAQNSALLSAVRLYANRVRKKSELGVLASINARAWSDLRARLELSDDEAALFETAPTGAKNQATLHVLPDRVIVVGDVRHDRLRAMLRARPLGTKTFERQALRLLGRGTFELTLPDEIEAGTAFEYGIEVENGSRNRLVWPPGFPKCTAVGTLFASETFQPPAAPAHSPVQPAARVTVVPERYAVELTWPAHPGIGYTVYRDDEFLGTVFDGWFEDTCPRSDATVRYTIAARHLGSGRSAAWVETVHIPELPLPRPPRGIAATTRANRIVLGWDSDCPAAAQYYILKYDDQRRIIEETHIMADFGHYLQISDQVESGKAYTYTIAAVAPDGRIGPSSRRIGIVASEEPLTPFVRLSVEDPSFLHGLAELAEQGIALGGKGWAELPVQDNWNPDHALTLSVWVMLDDLAGMPVLICKGAWEHSGYFLQIIGGQVRFYLAGVDTLDAGTVMPGVWRHIVATYGFDEMRIYLDGELAGRKRVTGRPVPSGSPVLVGRYTQIDEAYFVRGMMDEIRIYDVPLTPQEVEQLRQETQRGRP